MLSILIYIMYKLIGMCGESRFIETIISKEVPSYYLCAVEWLYKWYLNVPNQIFVIFNAIFLYSNLFGNYLFDWGSIYMYIYIILGVPKKCTNKNIMTYT